MKKIIIADGNNLGWMAFGIVPLTFEKQRVEAIFVGLNMIRGYLQRFDPDEFYLVWDGGRDPKRMALYPEYKRRKKELTKAEFKERSNFFTQLVKLQEVMKSIGIVQYRCKDREADDIIFNLLDEDTHSIVISTDKDFYQAFERDNVDIYNPVKKEIVKAKAVEKYYDVPASYFVDYRALVGDPSDNLPGVRGIGSKWAAWLINNVFDQSGDIKETTKGQQRMINLLFDNLKTYDLMRKLIKFMKVGKRELKEGRFGDRPKTLAELQERAVAICKQYGFEKHLNDFVNFIRPFEVLYRKQRK